MCTSLYQPPHNAWCLPLCLYVCTDSDDPSCATCGQAFGVGESYLTALGGSYHAGTRLIDVWTGGVVVVYGGTHHVLCVSIHSDCFSCNACGKVLSDSEDPVYSFEGKP